jgi:hypothetical protein
VVASVAPAELLVSPACFRADLANAARPRAGGGGAERAGGSIGVTRSTLRARYLLWAALRERARDAEAIAGFLAAGGRVIVTEARNLDRLEAVVPVEIRFRVREGRRALVVVTPIPSAQGSPP